MRETRFIMGMPVTLAVLDVSAKPEDLDAVFAEFVSVDDQFSPYKYESEIGRVNRGEVSADEQSPRMREILSLCEKTRIETNGYFNILRPDGVLDPSGVVKGWAIRNAASMLAERGFENFFVDAGGDVQSHGLNAQGAEWRVGILNPFHAEEIVKVLCPRGCGVATSGTYFRGQHIYNPHAGGEMSGAIVSLTVVGPDVLEADRYCTAAFAMGRDGISFINRLDGFEGYEIDVSGMARMTAGLQDYLPC
jgi:thiamine biosynthesis lipoprotein